MKQKKTPEQLQEERDAKIEKTLKGFQIQLIELSKQKKDLLGRVVQAKQLGLPVQEKQARGLLGNCLAQEKRVLGMQMQLELAVQSRNLSNLEQSFLECVNEMSDEISSNVSKTTTKKAKKNYMKALYNIDQQNQRMDDLLATGDYAMVAGASTGKFSEFDDQIDSMVDQAMDFDITRNDGGRIR